MKRLLSINLHILGALALLLGGYHWIVRLVVLRAFRNYSKGNYRPIINEFADDMTSTNWRSVQ